MKKTSKLFDKLHIYEVANQNKIKGGEKTVTSDNCTSLGTNDCSDCGDSGTAAESDSVVTTRTYDSCA